MLLAQAWASTQHKLFAANWKIFIDKGGTVAYNTEPRRYIHYNSITIE